MQTLKRKIQLLTVIKKIPRRFAATGFLKKFLLQQRQLDQLLLPPSRDQKIFFLKCIEINNHPTKTIHSIWTQLESLSYEP